MPTSEKGQTGLENWGGYIKDDFLREWVGKEAYKNANEMRLNSPVVGALLTAIEQSVRAVSWQFTSEIGSDDPRLEILNESLESMDTSFDDHISEALSFLTFGFSLFEIVYQRKDNRVLWLKFAPRCQNTVLEWRFGKNGSIDGFIQQAPPSYKTVELKSRELLHYRSRVEKNNPEGRSILRQAWVPYYYSKNIAQIEAIGIERDLAGLPVIKLPQNATTGTESTSDSSKAAKMVRNIRRDQQEGVVLPFEWEIDLLSTGGSRQFDTDKIVNRYENRILTSCLAQFLMLGQEGVGSFALSKDQTDLFVMSVNTVAGIISSTINKQAVPRLLKLNGYDAEGIKLEHSPAGDIDITELSDFLQKLGNKITWTAQDEVWIRGAGRLPELTVEEIEAEREKNREFILEQANANKPAFGMPGKTEEPDKKIKPDKEDEDKLTADLFEVDVNDDERRRYERKAHRELKTFFEAQQKRVIKMAKKVKKDAAI